jgi:hypothetical protein
LGIHHYGYSFAVSDMHCGTALQSCSLGVPETACIRCEMVCDRRLALIYMHGYNSACCTADQKGVVIPQMGRCSSSAMALAPPTTWTRAYHTHTHFCGSTSDSPRQSSSTLISSDISSGWMRLLQRSLRWYTRIRASSLQLGKAWMTRVGYTYGETQVCSQWAPC